MGNEFICKKCKNMAKDEINRLNLFKDIAEICKNGENIDQIE